MILQKETNNFTEASETEILQSIWFQEASVYVHEPSEEVCRPMGISQENKIFSFDLLTG